jgi:ribosomal-protein-alanine N-acetyltransferase
MRGAALALSLARTGLRRPRAPTSVSGGTLDVPGEHRRAGEHMLHLRTERLQLVAVTLELARAELAGPRRLEKLLAAHVPPSWPPPLNDEQSLRWTIDALAANPQGVGWFAWYFLHREHKELRLIGLGGFKGPPSADGSDEKGYAKVPQ